MSKLIEMLNATGTRSRAGVGFGLASRRQKAAPEVVLIGRVLPKDLAKKPKLAQAEADAFLVGIPDQLKENALDAISKALKDKVWGVRLGEFSAEQSRQLADNGCDFIVFESMDTEAAVLKEEMGAIVTLAHGLETDVVRAVRYLPIDAVLFSPSLRELPLTVGRLVDVLRVRGHVDRPFPGRGAIGNRSARYRAAQGPGHGRAAGGGGRSEGPSPTSGRRSTPYPDGSPDPVVGSRLCLRPLPASRLHNPAPMRTRITTRTSDRRSGQLCGVASALARAYRSGTSAAPASSSSPASWGCRTRRGGGRPRRGTNR